MFEVDAQATALDALPPARRRGRKRRVPDADGEGEPQAENRRVEVLLGAAAFGGFTVESAWPMTQPDTGLDLVPTLSSRPGATESLEVAFSEEGVRIKCGRMHGSQDELSWADTRRSGRVRSKMCGGGAIEAGQARQHNRNIRQIGIGRKNCRWQETRRPNDVNRAN